MKQPSRTPDEQYQLIMECRKSGLTDAQWCLQHDINPGTFYNWVSRLRKKATVQIPDPALKSLPVTPAQTEIVPLEIIEAPTSQNASLTKVKDDGPSLATEIHNPTILISTGKLQVSLTNEVDPKLLSQLLLLLGGK